MSCGQTRLKAKRTPQVEDLNCQEGASQVQATGLNRALRDASTSAISHVLAIYLPKNAPKKRPQTFEITTLVQSIGRLTHFKTLLGRYKSFALDTKAYFLVRVMQHFAKLAMRISV